MMLKKSVAELIIWPRHRENLRRWNWRYYQINRSVAQGEENAIYGKKHVRNMPTWQFPKERFEEIEEEQYMNE